MGEEEEGEMVRIREGGLGIGQNRQPPEISLALLIIVAFGSLVTTAQGPWV